MSERVREWPGGGIVGEGEEVGKVKKKKKSKTSDTVEVASVLGSWLMGAMYHGPCVTEKTACWAGIRSWGRKTVRSQRNLNINRLAA